MSRLGRLGAVGTVGLGLAAAAIHGPVGADEAFYRNRTVRIVVGYSAGGGFDFYSRALARHIGRHIPGEPTVVVENMPGAGGLIAANHLYRVARPDGLTVGHFTGGLLLGQVLGQKGAEFEARRFEYVGAPAKEHIACAVTSASGVTSVPEWRRARAPLKLGGSVPGASQDTATRIVKAALGLPIQLVTGYRGTAEIRLAADSGEIGGACFNWTSMRAGWTEALRAGEVRVVLLATPAPLPELPGVPLAIDLAPSPEARRLIQVGIHDQGALARPYVLPPGTPAERVRTLRRAFEATLRDAVFVAEAERARLDIDAVPGDELARIVDRLAELQPPIRATLRSVLFD
ncbi:MAG: Bug family tripartite tricarboxylate transporter substrate binding protein [Candidatus Rokuibacteriota bacterium]